MFFPLNQKKTFFNNLPRNYLIYLGFIGSMNKIGLTVDCLVATFANTCEGFERQRNLCTVRSAIFLFNFEFHEVIFLIS